jgi:hypothetical protein
MVALGCIPNVVASLNVVVEDLLVSSSYRLMVDIKLRLQINSRIDSVGFSRRMHRLCRLVEHQVSLAVLN